MTRRSLVSAMIVLTGVMPLCGAQIRAEEALPVEIHGFAESAGAGRLRDDPTQDDGIVLEEARFRLDLAHYGDRADISFQSDFLVDELQSGERQTDIVVRRARLTIPAASWLDVRLGRQVLTWGTGDLLFLNDLFPKDFVSFFIGREDEYLKAPSNSVKLAFYSSLANADVVWTPVFAPDRFITGERLSFYSPATGTIVSAATMGEPLSALAPTRSFREGELAIRIHRNLGGRELALYGYLGRTKQPQASDDVTGMPTFSRLNVYGASFRGLLVGGVATLEGAYYDSREDRDGIKPEVPNSQVRALAGYEHELVKNFTGAVQYYLEWIQDYEELKTHAPVPARLPVETRHLVTTRLTYRMKQETVFLSLFAFYSPNEEDGHLRPSLTYKWSDEVTLTAGANVMFGDEHTFFGQLEDNSNGYLRARYSF